MPLHAVSPATAEALPALLARYGIEPIDAIVWSALVQAVLTFGHRRFANSSQCDDYQHYLRLRGPR